MLEVLGAMVGFSIGCSSFIFGTAIFASGVVDKERFVQVVGAALMFVGMAIGWSAVS